MKNLRQFCSGLILILALSTTAFAGQMDCPGITQQPSEQTSTSATPCGEISCGVTSQTEYGVTDIVVSLIEAVLLLP